MRTVTPELVAFIGAFCNDSLPKEKKLEYFKTALTKHVQLTKEAAKGQGVDRHLFALQCLFKRQCQLGMAKYSFVDWINGKENKDP